MNPKPIPMSLSNHPAKPCLCFVVHEQEAESFIETIPQDFYLGTVPAKDSPKSVLVFTENPDLLEELSK